MFFVFDVLHNEYNGRWEGDGHLSLSYSPVTILITPLSLLLIQHLVEEAVKKVLLGGGGLLAGTSIDTSAVLAKIKEEKQESDDDVCIIEDDTPDPGPSSESEPVSPPSTKHMLYLPPDNCPQYKPTPIKELEKRAQASINPSIVRASSLTTTKSSVVPKPSSSKPKFSYVPSPTKKSVLGDIGDLTDSDEEKNENPDVLGIYDCLDL